MSVLVDKNTRGRPQGITGAAGQFHARRCREYGTKIVAGVTPGQGRHRLRGHPDLRHRRRRRVASDRRERVASSTCRRRSRPTRSWRRPTPASTLVVCITEGIPVARHGAREARPRGPRDAG